MPEDELAASGTRSPMHLVVWRFTTNVPAEFERHYGPRGTWARLFRHADGYVRTDLLRDDEDGHYVTLDWWSSRSDYDAFRGAHADDYARIDALCESVTTSEEKIGELTVIG